MRLHLFSIGREGELPDSKVCGRRLLNVKPIGGLLAIDTGYALSTARSIISRTDDVLTAASRCLSKLASRLA